MRVVVFSQYYPPEVGATQTRVQTFAEHLASLGHEVTAIVEVPNHPKGVVFDDYRRRMVMQSQEGGVRVVRVWVHTSSRKSFWRRISFYATYALNAAVAALVLLHRRPDVVFASSPPLPVLFPAWVLAARWRSPLVVDIRDIWPAVGVALGEVKGGAMLRGAEAIERAVYRRADAITCVTRGFVDHITALGADPEKVHLIPNGTLPAVFDPSRAEPGLARRLGLDGRFVVGYVGNHGIAQGLDAVVRAAAFLTSLPDVRFLLVGEGPRKAALVELAERIGATNVVFSPEVPLERAAAHINLCSVMVVPLRRLEVLEDFVPSKLFDYLACAKPVVLMVRGEAQAVLDDAGGGVFVEPEDPDALVSAIRTLRDDPEGRSAMGRRGREHVIGHYVRHEQAARVADLLVAVARARSG